MGKIELVRNNGLQPQRAGRAIGGLGAPGAQIPVCSWLQRE